MRQAKHGQTMKLQTVFFPPLRWVTKNLLLLWPFCHILQPIVASPVKQYPPPPSFPGLHPPPPSPALARPHGWRCPCRPACPGHPGSPDSGGTWPGTERDPTGARHTGSQSRDLVVGSGGWGGRTEVVPLRGRWCRRSRSCPAPFPSGRSCRSPSSLQSAPAAL